MVKEDADDEIVPEQNSLGKLELVSFILVSGEASDVKLTSEHANSFLIPRFANNLYHESYVEGCSFEEVAETKGTNKEAVFLP